MAQAIGGQAVLEGVMMRGPRNWAVAVRKPDGEIAAGRAPDRPRSMARHWIAPPPDRPRRRRARRVARDRLPRALGLRELRRRGRRRTRGRQGAGRDRPLDARSSRSSSRSASRSRSSRSARRCSPTRSRSRTATVFVLVEGLIRVTVFVGYLAAAQSLSPRSSACSSTTPPSTRRSTPTRPGRS